MPELEELLKQIGQKYSVEAVPLRLGGRELKILQFTDFEAYLEELIESQQVGPMDLPYWARLWESSLLLALFIGNQPLVPWQRMLEDQGRHGNGRDICVSLRPSGYNHGNQ